MREKEPRINRKTFKFLKTKPSPRKIKREVWLKPETAERIRRLAKYRQITFSRALELMLDTEEAEAISAKVKIDWQEKLRHVAPSQAVAALEGKLVRRKHPTS